MAGHTELSARSRAPILLSEAAPASFPHGDLKDGDRFTVGSVEIEIITIPGHSPDSICLCLFESGVPVALFSGDTLFAGDASGYRSSIAASLLESQGFTRVSNVMSGMFENREYYSVTQEMGLTKIGEIGGIADSAALAGCLGPDAKTEQFASEQELWKLIVDAVNAGKGIVMPYACAGDDGAPAWSVGADGFAHWCL